MEQLERSFARPASSFSSAYTLMRGRGQVRSTAMQSVHFHRMKLLRPCLFPRFPLPLTYLLPSYNHQGAMRIRPHHLATRSVSFPFLSRTRENNPHRLHVPQTEEPSIPLPSISNTSPSYLSYCRATASLRILRRDQTEELRHSISAGIFVFRGRPAGRQTTSPQIFPGLSVSSV